MTLRNQLNTLEATGLIRLATVQPELEYLFRHALIQDAAYASLVKFDRKQLHLAVGEALERLYADRLASQELAPQLAEHFARAGDGARALKYFTLAGDAAAHVYANVKAWYAAILAQLEIRRGDLAAAEAAIQEGYVGFDREDFSTPAPVLLPLADAELALAKHDANRAIVLMDELIAFLGLVGVRTFLADALHLKGQALAAQDRSEEAHATLTEARAAAEALGSRRALWPILAALAEIEARRGNAAVAADLRRQAREIIQYIADHCPPDLRASFLNLPDVRAVSATPNA